jgi:uncharacterized delta-60 repeat protein
MRPNLKFFLLLLVDNNLHPHPNFLTSETRFMKKSTLLLCLLVSFFLVKSQNGIPDPGFGINGVVKTPAPPTGINGGSFAKEGLLQADGKLVLAVYVNGKSKLTRRLADGTIDSGFANNGYSVVVSMVVEAAAMQADGKIVIAGAKNGQIGFMLARYNADGSLDASFGNGGITTTDFATSTFDFLTDVAITPSGNIIAGGLSNRTGVTQFTLVQYNSSGAIDNSFGVNGIVTTAFFGHDQSSLNSLAVQPDGKIIAAGQAFTNGNGNFAIARYNMDGTPDASFNFTGQTTTDISSRDVVLSVIYSSYGRIYTGGYTTDNFGVRHFTTASYNIDGTPDVGFNGTGFLISTFGSGFEICANVKQQPDGKLIASGNTVDDPLGNDIVLTRINVDGTIDNGFGTNGNGQIRADINNGYDEGAYLILQPDGKIITGGSRMEFISGFDQRFSGFRFNNSGTPDAGFGNGGSFAEIIYSSFLEYNAIFQQNDGKVLAVRSTNDGTFSQSLCRFNANGSVDDSFGNNGVLFLDNAGGSAVFQPDGKLLILNVGGRNNDDIKIVRHNTDGSVDAGFGNAGTVITDLGNFEGAAIVTFQPDGKFLAGGVSRDNNGGDFLILRYNADGSIDNSFGANGSVVINNSNEDGVSYIALAPDGKILFAGTTLTFFPIFEIHAYIGRLNANGSIDMSFADQGKKILNRGNNETMGNIAVQNNNKIVYTAYENASNNIPYLGRLNEDGSTDNSFGQNGIAATFGNVLTLLPNQRIITTGIKFNERNDIDFVMDAFTADGQPDVTFGNNGGAVHNFSGVDNSLYAFHLAGNYFYAAGGGSDDFGQRLGMIARFILDAEPPVVTNLTVNPTSLWPPNHSLRDVVVNYTVTDNVAIADTQIVVTSNEPVQSVENGDLAPDWVIVNDNNIKLRAERLNSGNGRVYTVKLIATDVNGNKDTATATVTVPKSQGNPNENELKLIVTPNPSPGQFAGLVKSKSNDNIRVRILKQDGTVVKTIGSVRPYQLFLFGNDLRRGTYFLEAKQGNEIKTTKILKL